MKLNSVNTLVAAALTVLAFTTPSKEHAFKSIVQSEQSTRNKERIDRRTALKENVSLRENYNQAGQLESYIRYNPDGSVYESTTVVWTEDSLSQTSITKNGAGELVRTWKSNWTSKGVLVGATNTDADGNITTIQSNKYDDSDNMIQRKMENPLNGKVSITDFVYDSEGNILEQTEYNPYQDRTDKRTYQYDDKGLETVQELFKGNGDYTKFVSEYDHMDNLIEMYWYDKDGVQTDQTSFTYVYDENGNWTTKTKGSEGKVTYVWEREIQYW